MTKHLAVAISAHGFGHAAQTTAVLRALRTRLPDIKLTLLTTLPRPLLADRIGGDFSLLEWSGDFGMRMQSALDIDIERSAADYAALHADWDAQVAATAQQLTEVGADLLLANVPYLALAGAARIGLPALALCSLNWLEIYRHYCGERPEAAGILKQMAAAYNSAQHFLCPAPSMPMPDLRNRLPIGPLARRAEDIRAELCDRLGVRASQRLVTVALGGIPMRFPVEDWPVDPEITWIVPHEWGVVRDDIRAFEGLGFAFTDVLGASDALLGKLGYGMVAECAVNGTPMLFIPRANWPEEPCLADWLKQHGRCLQADRELAMQGQLRGLLDTLWAMPAPPQPAPSGADDAAEVICRCLGVAGGDSGDAKDENI